MERADSSSWPSPADTDLRDHPFASLAEREQVAAFPPYLEGLGDPQATIVFPRSSREDKR